MKLGFCASIVVFSSITQAQVTIGPAKLDNYMISVSVVGATQTARTTGIQIKAGVVVIPETIKTLCDNYHAAVMVNGKPAQNMLGVSPGMMAFEVEGLGVGFKPLKAPAQLPVGNFHVIYAGYRNGTLVVKPGIVRILASGGVLPVVSPDEMTMGWGIFTLEGRFVGIVVLYRTITLPEVTAEGLQLGRYAQVAIQPGNFLVDREISIQTKVEKLLSSIRKCRTRSPTGE